MFSTNWKKVKSQQEEQNGSTKRKRTYVPTSDRSSATDKPKSVMARLPMLSSLQKTTREVLLDPRKNREVRAELFPKANRSVAVKATKQAKVAKVVDPKESYTLNKFNILVPHLLEPVAIDCEMVQVRNKHVLAQVVIVSQSGEVIYNKMVNPVGKITDYFPAITGFSAASFKNAIEFKRCVTEVDSVIRDRIIVGHGLENDFKALMLAHPEMLTRDTAEYSRFQAAVIDDKDKTIYQARKLKDLAKEYLAKNVQMGVHSAVEDARIAMELYNSDKQHWEKLVNIVYHQKLREHWKQVMMRESRRKKHIELQRMIAEKKEEKRLARLEKLKPTATLSSDSESDSDSDSDSSDSDSDDDVPTAVDNQETSEDESSGEDEE